MCTSDNLYLSQLLGKRMGKAFLETVNFRLRFDYGHLPRNFEISHVALSILGTKPENAFLFAEIIVKGEEFSPIELHIPLSTCKSRYLINKNAVSVTPDYVLPILRNFFQEVASNYAFGDEIIP